MVEGQNQDFIAQIEHFNLIKKLGDGVFGTGYLAVNTTT